MASPTINTLTSFSGSDLVVTFANQVVGELQQISWGVQREKAPIFTLGSPDARSFSRGKRAIAGSMVFAVFDHDSVIAALQHVWGDIAPPAMFTAKGNIAVRNSENFLDALDMIRWNKAGSDTLDQYYKSSGDNNLGFGYVGSGALTPQKHEGSNGRPTKFDNEYEYFVEQWGDGDQVHVPPGFGTIKGENVQYADTMPPFDVTMTFGNEYGQAAFQKIYDVDILNEASGVSTDTVVMERQLTYIARKISPLIRGIYSREDGGMLKGISPTADK